jgi:hypothetical protein
MKIKINSFLRQCIFRVFRPFTRSALTVLPIFSLISVCWWCIFSRHCRTKIPVTSRHIFLYYFLSSFFFLLGHFPPHFQVSCVPGCRQYICFLTHSLFIWRSIRLRNRDAGVSILLAYATVVTDLPLVFWLLYYNFLTARYLLWWACSCSGICWAPVDLLCPREMVDQGSSSQ